MIGKIFKHETERGAMYFAVIGHLHQRGWRYKRLWLGRESAVEAEIGVGWVTLDVMQEVTPEEYNQAVVEACRRLCDGPPGESEN